MIAPGRPEEDEPKLTQDVAHSARNGVKVAPHPWDTSMTSYIQSRITIKRRTLVATGLLGAVAVFGSYVIYESVRHNLAIRKQIKEAREASALALKRDQEMEAIRQSFHERMTKLKEQMDEQAAIAEADRATQQQILAEKQALEAKVVTLEVQVVEQQRDTEAVLDTLLEARTAHTQAVVNMIVAKKRAEFCAREVDLFYLRLHQLAKGPFDTHSYDDTNAPEYAYTRMNTKDSRELAVVARDNFVNLERAAGNAIGFLKVELVHYDEAPDVEWQRSMADVEDGTVWYHDCEMTKAAKRARQLASRTTGITGDHKEPSAHESMTLVPGSSSKYALSSLLDRPLIISNVKRFEPPTADELKDATLWYPLEPITAGVLINLWFHAEVRRVGHATRKATNGLPWLNRFQIDNINAHVDFFRSKGVLPTAFVSEGFSPEQAAKISAARTRHAWAAHRDEMAKRQKAYKAVSAKGKGKAAEKSEPGVAGPSTPAPSLSVQFDEAAYEAEEKERDKIGCKRSFDCECAICGPVPKVPLDWADEAETSADVPTVALPPKVPPPLVPRPPVLDLAADIARLAAEAEERKAELKAQGLLKITQNGIDNDKGLSQHQKAKAAADAAGKKLSAGATSEDGPTPLSQTDYDAIARDLATTAPTVIATVTHAINSGAELPAFLK